MKDIKFILQNRKSEYFIKTSNRDSKQVDEDTFHSLWEEWLMGHNLKKSTKNYDIFVFNNQLT